mmetsp:Transcript_8921/g.19342  ORF Transcript_8921/g.19342 Transcript_8921/m.19342 type:complete len:228 (-) Transcript_8921:1062-1745(-)
MALAASVALKASTKASTVRGASVTPGLRYLTPSLVVTSCSQSAMSLPGGRTYPSFSKWGTMSSRGPWYTMRPVSTRMTSSKRSYVSGGGCSSATRMVARKKRVAERSDLVMSKVAAESRPVEISSRKSSLFDPATSISPSVTRRFSPPETPFITSFPMMVFAARARPSVERMKRTRASVSISSCAACCSVRLPIATMSFRLGLLHLYANWSVSSVVKTGMWSSIWST